MDPEKIKQILENAGKYGKWVETKEQSLDPKVLQDSRKCLLKLRELLEAHLQKDISERDRMHEVLMRLKHGGGV